MNFKPLEIPLIDWGAYDELISYSTRQIIHVIQNILQTTPIIRVVGEMKNERNNESI